MKILYSSYEEFTHNCILPTVVVSEIYEKITCAMIEFFHSQGFDHVAVYNAIANFEEDHLAAFTVPLDGGYFHAGIVFICEGKMTHGVVDHSAKFPSQEKALGYALQLAENFKDALQK